MLKTNKRISCLLLVIIVFIGLMIHFSNDRDEEITICALGDIMFDRGVELVLGREGFDYPYTDIKHILLNSDITVANLECPLFDGHNPVYKRKSIIFNGDTRNARYIKESGINLLNLANNHTLDHKEEGLISTMSVLDSEGIGYYGADKDPKKSKIVKVVDIKDQKIGFLGYSTFPIDGYISSFNRAFISIFDEDTIEEEIMKAKKQCDFLIVTFHWGKEYERDSSETQQRAARLTIDCGADLIIGHHPHVLQEEEVYKGKYIFYSLGNFIFDRQIPKHTDESIILRLSLKDGVINKIDRIPVIIKDCKPMLVE